MQKNRDYKITIDFLDDYMESSLENAKELIDEAKLLYDNGHYARTYFLAVAAIEEVGKAHISYSAKGRRLNDIGLCNKIEKQMDSHSQKITAAFACWILKSNDHSGAVDTGIELITHLKQGRELSMYTDVKLGSAEISKPCKVIRKVAARDTISVANNCFYHTSDYVKENAPAQTDKYQDKLTCIPDSKVSQIYKIRDFWEYYIGQLEKGDENSAKHIVKYYDDYFCQEKKYDIKNS